MSEGKSRISEAAERPVSKATVALVLSREDAQALYDHTGTMPFLRGSWPNNVRAALSGALGPRAWCDCDHLPEDAECIHEEPCRKGTPPRPPVVVRYDGEFVLAWLADDETVCSAGDGTGAAIVTSPRGSFRIDVGEDFILTPRAAETVALGATQAAPRPPESASSSPCSPSPRVSVKETGT